MSNKVDNTRISRNAFFTSTRIIPKIAGLVSDLQIKAHMTSKLFELCDLELEFIQMFT